MADDGLRGGRHVGLLDDEVAAVEEGGHGSAEQQGPHDAVEHEANLEGLGPEEVAEFVLELVAHGLHDEREEDEHPYPVGAAEAGAVEEGERGEERGPESGERGEGEFPLAPGGVDDEPPLLGRPAELEYHGVGALYEHQEHEESSHH